jgi:hypothetical protein
MVRFWQHVQDLVARMLVCVIVLATIVVDRISQSSHALATVAGESGLDPHQTLLRVVTIMIGSSLSMMALGYRARS